MASKAHTPCADGAESPFTWEPALNTLQAPTLRQGEPQVRIGIVEHGTTAIVRQCPGPLSSGRCALLSGESGTLPCAGQQLLLKLRVTGKRKSWLFDVSPAITECPVYHLSGGLPGAS